MSLDVYLSTPGIKHERKSSGIFIREGGQMREIERAEWDRLYPGREPVMLTETASESEDVYSANITHNLGKMAEEAGIYKHLWRPDEIGVKKASELIDPLKNGLRRLQDEPNRFRAHNPENGWGSYEGFVEFVGNYLAACRQYPEADVRVWR